MVADGESTALKDAWDTYEATQKLMAAYKPTVPDAVSAIKSKGDGYVKTGKGLAAEARRVSNAATASWC
ncbi:hypothetical protein ABZ461_22760 [Actinacidiphila glaucinigra]|uniref:hypothetical protein n=1 Tax=Actinacidiphila glaucinigra TaxID=235986 RepID=UPI0033F081D9